VDKLEIEAVYEHGLLRLPRELPLPAGQRVKVTIEAIEGAAKRRSGRIQWRGSREDLEYLAESDDNHLRAGEA
jgi:predicted DNA-binding antitoxin AbrB/MazE fold protein